MMQRSRAMAFFACGWLALGAVLAVGAAQNAQAQLVAQPDALRHGLQRSWFTQADVDGRQGRLAHITLDNDLLLVQTTQGLLQAIEAETGGVRWTQRVGRPGVPSVAPTGNSRHVAAGAGNELYLFERRSGAPIWVQKLPSTVQSGMVMNETRVFVTLSNSWVESLTLEDPKTGEWHYASKGFIVHPPVITRQLVVWTTDQAATLGANFDTSTPALQFRSEEPLAAPPSYYPNFVFLPLTSRQLYCVQTLPGRNMGQVYWRFYAADDIVHAAAPVENALYVSTATTGVYCLEIDLAAAKERRVRTAIGAEVPAEPESKEIPTRLGGIPRWIAPRGAQFLAASATKAYLRDHVGRLLIVDNTTGAHLSTLPLPGVNRFVVNTQTDRIYLADDLGLIQCLRERELDQPLVHPWPVDPEEEAAKEKKKDAKKKAAK